MLSYWENTLVSKQELSLPNPESYDVLLASNKDSGWPDIPPTVKLFVHKFLETSNVSKAARECGIPTSEGVRILKHALVNDYLNDVNRHYRDISVLDRSFIELQLLETLAQANGDVPVYKMNRDGDTVEGKHVDLPSKIAVLKEMKGMANIKDGARQGGVSVTIDLKALGVEGSVEVTQGETIEHDDGSIPT